MTPNENKLAIKFKLSAEDAALLVAAGLDNPVKVRQALTLPDKLSEAGSAAIAKRKPFKIGAEFVKE